MKLPRSFTFAGAACAAGLVLGAGVAAPTSASVPPSSAPESSGAPSSTPPTEATIATGLSVVLGELGTVTYEGDDITVGDCPFADATDAATAFTGVADDVDLTADDEAQIEVFADYETGQEFEPAALSCDFEATADDAGLESVSILVADPSGEGIAEAFESLPVTLEPVGAEEASAIGGELRGACMEDECLFTWTGAGAVIAVSVEFDDNPAPDLDATSSATRALVTAVAGHLAERA